MPHGYGWKPQAPDHRDWALVDAHAPAKLPASLSLRNNPCMPPVYDQGQLGSCTANAIAAAYEWELRAQAEDFMPSRLWIYYQERLIEGTVSQDAGAEIRDGLKVTAAGVCPESDWPYDISTFTGPPPAAATADAAKSRDLAYYSLSTGPGMPLRACLAAGFPFVFGFSVPTAFESLTAASPYLPLPGPNDQFVGGHAVCAVGYDWTCTRFPTPVFEVRNSWGDGWGDAGYCFVDYRLFDSLASDLWTIRKVA